MKDKNLMRLFIRFVIFYEFFILITNGEIIDYNKMYYIDVFIFVVSIVLFVVSIFLHKQDSKIKFLLHNILLVPILIPFFLATDPVDSMVFRLLICYGLVMNYAVPHLLKQFTPANLLKSLAILFFYVLSFGTIMMHVVEGVSFSDGLWWSIVTMTTISYGDIYPVTQMGRFLALFVIFGGIICMAIFTAFIVEKTLGDNKKPKLSDLSEEDINELKAQIKEENENQLPS